MSPQKAAGPFTKVPTIISHRGFGKGAGSGFGENTLPAFREALCWGLEWLEVDVRRSADDQLFVLHHPSVEDGSFLVDLPAAQIRSLGVLALDDLLAELPAGIGVVFDVKTSLEDALRPAERTTAGLLVPVLEREQGRRPLLVTSFDPASPVLIRDRVPGVATGLLSWLAFPLRKAIPAAVHLGLDVVSVHGKSFTANTSDVAPHRREIAYSMDIAHRAGLQVIAWSATVDLGAQLVAAGVDALIVDDIPQALRITAPEPAHPRA